MPLAEGSLCTCGCRPAKPRRFCACGCNREITHRRADAQTFGASCRQALARAEARRRLQPDAARTCQCESGFFFRNAEGDAVCGLCGCWLARVTGPVGDFDLFAEAMSTNGTYVRRRVVPREWRTRRLEAVS
jgi:hypothetical protein